MTHGIAAGQRWLGTQSQDQEGCHGYDDEDGNCQKLVIQEEPNNVA